MIRMRFGIYNLYEQSFWSKSIFSLISFVKPNSMMTSKENEIKKGNSVADWEKNINIREMNRRNYANIDGRCR